MDVRQLTYFLGIVDHGGFGRASEALHVSQPSLSQAMKHLERELGVQLFHRVGRGVTLAEAGQQLVGPARQALRAMGTARDAVLSTRRLERGKVDVIAMPSPGIEPMTSLVRSFTSRHPGMTVDVAAGFTADEVVTAVHSGAAEIGLLGTAGRPHASEVRFLALGRQPLVLISPPGTQGGDTVTRADFDRLDVVISQRGSLMRQLVDDVLAAGTDVHVVAEVAHRTSLLPLVLAGVGHSVMPDSWRTTAERMGCRVRMILPPSYLDVWIAYRHDALSPGAEAFLEIATDEMNAHVATGGRER